jgi:hypothetical protein
LGGHGALGIVGAPFAPDQGDSVETCNWARA